MRRILWFTLEFVALTAPLTWLWVSGGREWFASTVFVPLAGAVYDLLGLEVRPVWRERYIHYVPFVALVLLTPRLGGRRRATGLIGGLVAMFFVDVAINGVAQAGERRPVDLPLPLMVLSDALPLAVWCVVAHRFVADLARGVRAGGDPPRGAEAEGEGGSPPPRD